MRCSGSSIISFHCAIQPTVRANEKITVNIEVGKPMASLLVQKGPVANATVTIAHSRTQNLSEITKQADILVAAIGRPNFITADMVKPGACVIDVGINRVADGRLVGDVDFAEFRTFEVDDVELCHG